MDNIKHLRAYTDENTNERYITGYASVFDTLSKRIRERGETFYEIIRQGAFDDADLNNVILYVDHNRDKLLARTKNETLTLEVDDYGLYFRALIPDTQLGNDIYTLVERGDYDQNSFAFSTNDDEDIEKRVHPEMGKVHVVNRIRKVSDVSLVQNAAYGDATYIEMNRSIDDFLNESNTHEEIKRNNLDYYRRKLRLEELKNNK